MKSVLTTIVCALIIFLNSQVIMSFPHPALTIISADQLSLNSVQVHINQNNVAVSVENIIFSPALKILQFKQNGDILSIETELMRHDENYSVSIKDSHFKMLNPDHWLNTLYSNKVLGFSLEPNKTIFRVFAPRASQVNCVIFNSATSTEFNEQKMTRDPDGVWELVVEKNLTGQAYGYRVFGKQDSTEWFNPNIIIADPYSPAVTTINNYHHQARTLIMDFSFDWKGDKWVNYPKQESIIYEAQLRDLTADPSSGSSQPGTYLGLLDSKQKGGLPYIKNLGVNTIEFLPLHEFANIEIPYGIPSDQGITNNWNYYARNHWGYMTSYFFAPESYYASDGNMKPDNPIGTSGKQVFEMKEMVRTLHENKISVLLDVVYNHVSQYDYNPLKLIDKKYYFRLDQHFNPLSVSGCGNDLKTERPMARRLIIESIKFWMQEYHIDGFRFDLAQMIDKETCKLILQEAQKINPDVFIIAEPWGGGYDPNGFSDIGWSSWNDQIRNGIKGWNPGDEKKGFIFGQFRDGYTYPSLVRWITGSLREDGGQYVDVSHSVNYIESHDDATFGDFVREAIGRVKPHEKIKDFDKNAKLTPQEIKLHKLAALFLLTSQGATMIHAGQEFGRSQVIAKSNTSDPRVGELDHNSYDKDNATNYLNYHHADLNSDLVSFYKGLISLRKQYKTLTYSSKSNMNFYPYTNPLLLMYELEGDSFHEPDLLVIMNGDTKQTTEIKLPEGNWTVLFSNSESALKSVSGHFLVHPSDGYIFIKEK